MFFFSYRRDACSTFQLTGETPVLRKQARRLFYVSINRRDACSTFQLTGETPVLRFN
ncbi:MAG: hypothetical protein SXA11_17040 [Cyanobacteriota bacterium]|nr:hypothetical protein [Cyanobacteriota bacterium]